MTAQQLRRAPGSSGLYDVLELILDRGLVIDAYARVSLVGIEILTVDLRVVVASVDTYIRYAEAMERLGWHERERTPSPGLPDMVGGRVSSPLKSNGRGVARALATGAHTAAEATGSALAHGAERLKESLVGEGRYEGEGRNEGETHADEQNAAQGNLPAEQGQEGFGAHEQGDSGEHQ